MTKLMRNPSARGRYVATVFAVALAVALSSNAAAELIVDMTFTPPNSLENTGIGPDGVLKGGASITAGGQLRTNGSNADEPVGAGLDLPLGELARIFNGANDFLVEFDFQVVGTRGSLFSADGSHTLADPGDPEDKQGALNIYVGTSPDSGDFGVIADLWFMGEISIIEDDIDLDLDDEEFHHLLLTYTAATNTLELTVDDLPPVSGVFDYFRNTADDIVRLGDENNGDFGADINPTGFNGLFDNLRIVGTLNVPEPSALLMMSLGTLLCLGRRPARGQ